MKLKTKDLIGQALDYAVARAMGKRPSMFIYQQDGDLAKQHRYSRDWSQGGPIIEREVVSLGVEEGGWRALCWGMDGPNRELYSMRGPTPLIAAMRCYVASKMGDEVDVPEELL